MFVHFHPFFFAYTLILFTYFNNYTLFPISVVVLPIFIVSLFILFLFLFLNVFLKSFGKSAIVASTILIANKALFMLLRFIQNHVIFPLLEGMPFILPYKLSIANICLLILVLTVAVKVRHAKGHFKTLNSVLNVFSVILLLLITINFLLFKYKYTINFDKISISNISSQKQKKSPNIYHIILDAYTNNEVLSNTFKYDNTPFISELKKYGFKIKENSFSHYPITQPSLYSTFYCNYVPIKQNNCLLENLEKDFGKNIVFENFSRNNYKIVSYLCGVDYSSRSPFISVKIGTSNHYLFWIALFEKSFLSNIVKKVFVKRINSSHYSQILESLDNLKGAQSQFGQNNNLFFSHILCPHEPFVIRKDGGVNLTSTIRGFFLMEQTNKFSQKTHSKLQEEFKNKYVAQVNGLNNKLLPILKSIITQYPSDNQPIIILHGDHGYSPFLYDHNQPESIKTILGNLLAVYWNYELFDINAVSLVNLYRIIFNIIFQENHRMLPNRYFINYYNFSKIHLLDVSNVIEKITLDKKNTGGELPKVDHQGLGATGPISLRHVARPYSSMRWRP